MRIGLQSWGSEGDTRPFLALASGLAEAGHDVTLAALDHTGRDWSPAAERGGFRLIRLPRAEKPSEREADRLWRKLLAAGPLRQLEMIYQAFDPDLETQIGAAQTLCAENDLLIGHFMVHPLRAAAELAKKPWASLVPIHTAVPTGTSGPFGLPDLGPWSYPLAWGLTRFAVNRVVLGRVNALRRRLGLAPDRDVLRQSWASDRLNLIATSPSLCQRPADWGPEHVMCGFLDRPEAGFDPLPPGIEAFLAAGRPPVYVTFGSMMALSAPHRAETAALMREAARLAGVRAILQIPEAEPGPDGDCLIVNRAPYVAVFPHCALVVHHGGAGTTQTVLRAGVPALIVAHIADQFFWGAHLADLGAAVPPLKRHGLTARKLADGIRRGLAMSGERAAELGRAVAAENGVERAVEAVDRTFGRRLQSPSTSSIE